MKYAKRRVCLTRHRDIVMAIIDQGEPQPVTLVYARPISARESEIAIMDAKRKKELLWLESLDELDAASRIIADEELYRRYRILTVLRVTHSQVDHGHRYLKVETDRGPRYFNLREPGKNVTHLTDDRLVLRDSMGNRFEIPSIAKLDEESRENLERVL